MKSPQKNEPTFIVTLHEHSSNCGTKWKGGVGHAMALQFTLKKILRQKKNYGNSNILPCKKYLIFKKSSKRNQNPSRYYNFTTIFKFQHKTKYHLLNILIYK